MVNKDSVLAVPITPAYPYVKFANEEIEQSISTRFERQARLWGDRLAIRTEDGSLTYNALNAIANRLARRILAIRGSHPEPIALMFHHGAAPLMAMLGVLKSGKFYLVLDPSLPRERLAYMLSDSGSGLIVTDTKNLPLACNLSSQVTD